MAIAVLLLAAHRFRLTGIGVKILWYWKLEENVFKVDALYNSAKRIRSKPK